MAAVPEAERRASVALKIPPLISSAPQSAWPPCAPMEVRLVVMAPGLGFPEDYPAMPTEVWAEAGQCAEVALRAAPAVWAVAVATRAWRPL